MDTDTVKHYDELAESFAKLYENADVSSLHNTLKRWLPTQGRVLEIGCGSGRDARYIASFLGLNVIATDASEKIIEFAKKLNFHQHIQEKISFIQASFPLPPKDTLLKESFEAIVSIAGLMHIPDYELFEFAYQIRGMLRDGGIFVCSFSANRENSDDPRLFVNREAGEVQLLFERVGFTLLAKEENKDGLGRPLSWITLVFAYDFQLASRPVDQIESIINRDNKTATYKLALLRALCEISQKSFHHVKWHSGERVSLPLGLVVEKWIYYYWPLFDSDFELPEMRLGKRVKGLAFRPILSTLIERFKPGGLNAFFALFQSGRLDDEQAFLLGQVSTQIAKTIIKGPITYSGGSLKDLDQIFTFEGKQSLKKCRFPSEMIDGFGRVYFPAAIWRELCLVGQWIGEAILLRWAELSRTFTKMSVDLSTILRQLLINPEAERATGEAKKIFSNERELFCVWSNKKLRPHKFDVDHVIPFSIWHNNDLWNLLPADPKVNNQKRDKIVTRETLQNRRDFLIHYWRIMFKSAPVRFSNEVGKTLLGNNFQEKNWEKSTFSALSEATEIIARQRGVERWQA